MFYRDFSTFCGELSMFYRDFSTFCREFSTFYGELSASYEAFSVSMEYLYRPSEESPREGEAIYAAHYYIKHYREGINGRAGKENYRGGEAPAPPGVRGLL
jgi:hypothetical protein